MFHLISPPEGSLLTPDATPIAPEHAAILCGSARTSFVELDARSSQFARALTALGLAPGDGIAILLENRPEFLEVAWAARRAGLYYTPVNTHLTRDEVAYIVRDCGTKVLITSEALVEIATAASTDASSLRARVLLGERPRTGFLAYEGLLAAQSAEPFHAPVEGVEMFYSSGTTGRPKGVRRALGVRGELHPHVQSRRVARELYGQDERSVYLVPAPLYHAAPLVASMTAHTLGSSVVLMERFDARTALSLIERHSVTHAQFVPTMFVRMLRLPEAERRGFDLSSLRCAVHAAAPCPVPVKEAMLAWWGPILHEYYNATESLGGTRIGPEEWLAHKGSVGRAPPTLHVLDEDGRELPRGGVGTIYFEAASEFAYHNDAKKTADSQNERGWRTVGDMGYVDDAGYLYLTDRATFMIVSGGVNIYPQEAENCLATHPEVADVAVFGVPNEEFGEEVKAVVQVAPEVVGDAALSARLLSFCREHLASYKCPRSIDFAEVPRDANGKLYKRRLRDPYWAGRTTRVL